MDPQATLRLMSECIDDGDYMSLGESCEDLCAWIGRGGFVPADTLAQLDSMLARINVEQVSTRESLQAAINMIR